MKSIGYIPLWACLSLPAAALAHPSANTPFFKIGLDSTLVIQNDINVLPETQDIDICQGQVSTSGCSLSVPSCRIYLEHSSAVDRVIRKGTVLNVIGSHNEDYSQGLFLSLTSGAMLTCTAANSTQAATLEQANQTMQNVAVLVPAAPVPLEDEKQLEEQTELKPIDFKTKGFTPGSIYWYYDPTDFRNNVLAALRTIGLEGIELDSDTLSTPTYQDQGLYYITLAGRFLQRSPKAGFEQNLELRERVFSTVQQVPEIGREKLASAVTQDVLTRLKTQGVIQDFSANIFRPDGETPEDKAPTVVRILIRYKTWGLKKR